MTAREAASLPPSGEPLSSSPPPLPSLPEDKTSDAAEETAVKYSAPKKWAALSPRTDTAALAVPYAGHRLLLIATIVALCSGVLAALLLLWNYNSPVTDRNSVYGDPNELQYSATAHRTLPPKQNGKFAAGQVPKKAPEAERRHKPVPTPTKKTCSDGKTECDDSAVMTSSTQGTATKVPAALENHFKKAVYWVRNNPALSEDDKLATEALLHQATRGDATDIDTDSKHHPSLFAAWRKLKGTKRMTAMANYVAHVVKVDANWLKSRIMELYPDDYAVT